MRRAPVYEYTVDNTVETLLNTVTGRHWKQCSNLSAVLTNSLSMYRVVHGLRTSNEGINQRNLKIRANVADKICFGCT